MRHAKHECDCTVNTNVLSLAATITGVQTLAERLKYARELRHLTQGELAAKAHCVQGTIGNIEKGTRKTLRNLVDVARALQVSPEWLQDGRGPGPKSLLGMHEPAVEYRVWPFSVSYERFERLPPEVKQMLDAQLSAAIASSEAVHRPETASGKRQIAA